MGNSMSSRPLVSVICSTYNNPFFLEMALLSLKEQSFKSFEVIIADDGSGPATKKLIEKYQVIFPFLLIHAWHEDKGYRKNKIQNQAISMSCGQILVFIDDNCICRKNFLRDHAEVYKSNKESDYILIGRKVELGKKYTSILRPENISKSLLGLFPFKLWLSCLDGDSRSFLRTYSVKNLFLRKVLKADHVGDILEENYSLPKKTMAAINRLDEKNSSVNDVSSRLRNSGIKKIEKKYFAPMFQLYREERLSRT